MPDLPETHGVPVVRADFSDDAIWTRLQADILSPTEQGYVAQVEFVEDRRLAGLDADAIVAAFPGAYPHRYPHPVVFVIDAVTVSSPEHPLLVIDLNESDASAPFRTTPQQVPTIECNLSIANVDFFEFAAMTDADGVYRR